MVGTTLLVPGMDGVLVLLVVVLASSIAMYTLGGNTGSPTDAISTEDGVIPNVRYFF